MIYNQDMDKKHGQMDLNTLVIFMKVKNKAKENIFILMDLHMKVIGLIII